MPDPLPDDPPKASILLVDDDAQVLATIQASLRSLGQRLVPARNGTEALEYTDREEFAVILLDVQMSGMDGFETAERIRSGGLNVNTPIIFLTGVHSSLQKKEMGYKIGAVDYMIKPFDVIALRTKIGVFVDMFMKFRQLKGQIAALQAERSRAPLRELARTDAARADLSHDLRTPLNSIIGFAELMYDSPVALTPDRSREYLGYILDSSLHLLSLVDQVLNEESATGH